jgi:hypothetical protein
MTVVFNKVQTPAPSFLYILKLVSFVELSFHARVILPIETDTAVRLVGDFGVPASPVVATAQLL